MSVFREDALAGRVAVVTGAARGIGRAAAVALATAGADVAGIDICAVASERNTFKPATEEDLAETGRVVEATGSRWRAIVTDQRDITALRAARDAVLETFGRVDVLFANAGIQAFVPLLEMADADWHDTINVNLNGTANTIRVFAPVLVDTGNGSIIVTSSTQGQHGTLDGVAYSASKWGIIGLMKSAALELGPRGVRVNALVPGLIDTALTRHEDRYAQALRVDGKEPSGDERTDEEEARKALAGKSPLRRPWLEPESVAPAVVFLASDASALVSGTSFAVTGGDSANITA